MTFEGKFTASALASGVSVPSGEHFTTLIGAVHNGSVTFWSSGAMASAGVEGVAELGNTGTFKSEINDNMNAVAVIEKSLPSGGTPTATADFAVTTAHPLVTLLTMVAPSPDWFVGVSGLSLLDAQGDWLASYSVDLFPYDAGTEEGTEFSLSNAATSPQGTIASIKGTGKFSDEPIASLTFTLQSVTPEITSATTFTVDEGTKAVETLTVEDQDSAAADLEWSKAGGADAGQFTLSSGGVLAFAATPDYENPGDADGDRTYEVTVQVSDGDHTDSEDLSVTVGNVVELAAEVSGPAAVPYAENGAVRVATFIASSPEDNGDVAWSLSGADSSGFSIDGGALRFLSLPDFESPSDMGTDNMYSLTVAASDGVANVTKDVTVTVTDRDEAGALTLSSTIPRLGTPLTADVTDPDVVTGTTRWTWERSSGRTGWNVISGAASSSYTPVAADGGNYLRATASYTDRHSGGKQVRAVPPNVVLGRTLSRLEVTTSSSRSMYPAFDPEILHYAVGCQDTLTLTLSTGEPDTRLAVNGIQRANRNVAVELTGLAGGSDIPITLTGSEGASTTYVLHCLADEFPAIITEKKPGAWDGLITIGVRADPGSYLAIIDNNGVPRIHWWIRESVRIFRTHRDGRYPYSYGQLSRFLPYDQQAGSRKVTVLDENLEPVDTVTTVPPLHHTDLHDFVIKSNGNYLLMAYEPARRDMSQFIDSTTGDPYSTTELTRDSVIQEVTPDKEEAFNWNSWDHMAIEDCTQHRFPDDYAHVNSVQAFDDDIVASFRGCSKVLRIDGDSGDVIWRLGKSNRSDAAWTASGTQPPLRIVGDPYGEFCGQHSARMIGNGNLLLFDNGVACLVDPEGNRTRPGEDFSRVVEYAIDPDHGEAIFQRHYSYHGEFNELAQVQGHIEQLETGNWLISWGSMPVNEQITEYSPLTGEEVLIVKLHVLGDSDRGVRTTAYPVSPVALAKQVAPLTAEIVESPAGSAFHLGPTDAPKVVVAFSRPVVDLAADTTSVSVSGATIAGISPHVVPGDPANAYLFTLTPTGVGPITFALVAGQSCASDGICTADGTVLTEVPASHVIPPRPTGPAVASIASSATHPTKDGFTVTISFSEPVTGLTADEIEVTNGTGSNFAGAGAVYTLDIAPDAGIEDDVTVTVTADAVMDGLNNGNLQASEAFSVDTKAPAVSTTAIASDPGTDRTYAAGDDIQVTVTFSEMVEVEGRPQLTLRLGSGDRTADYQGGTGTAALVFVYEVEERDEDTDGVSIEANRLSLNGGTIRDGSDNDAVLDHDGLAADSGHKVDAVKPQLAASGGAVVDGTMLTLTYDEPLDGSSRPEAGDFTVAGGDQARTVTRVSVSGSTVELTLDAGAEHEEAEIRVSYTPGVNPIQDVPGNDAEALSREPVTNETPDTTAPTLSSLAITSNPPDNRDTYAIGDVIEATVTFGETVVVRRTPRLRLRVGSRTRTADYRRGTDTAALVFGYEVADGDEDSDGVSLEAGRIALNGGTIEDEAENAAELDHEAVATQAGHKVDGVRPELSSAAVNEAVLTLTYGEALDSGSRPASGDFTVEVDGDGRSVSGVSISGSVVTLFLNPAVEHGDTGIRVSYTPDTNPIRDAVGNEAQGLSNRSVTNTTGAPNTAPEITSPSSFDVPENQALARRLEARDTDPGDEVTGWAIVGGADQGQFTITSDTGDLSFRTAPDYEAPGDNQYEVTVEVTSGAGARELEAEQTFTLRVTDEREPPGIPEAPTFSGETADSLTVYWSEPDNTGPAITDYDVQYREGRSGGFTDAQHEGPGLTATLSGLKEGTAYQVQVRATNEEGTSDWSEPGEGMTVTPLRVPMTTDLPPPVESAFAVRFSFSEPVRGFTSSDIVMRQEPPCTDSANNPVFCNPTIAALQTTDDRIFTTTVAPRTDQVAHNYTLTLTVPAGRVTSAAGNKPNEEARLEVRVAPPGVTVPMSSIGLRANAGNGQVTLRWSTPDNSGGAAIVRYEYRWGESGGEFGDWMSVAPSARSATVRNLTNDTEYVFEVRGVNALGYGMAETAMAAPEEGGGFFFPPPPPPPPASNSPTADAGPDQLGVWEGALVTLDGSGSSDPDDDPLRYRWNQFSGEPVVLSSRNVVNPTFTAPEGLTADAVLRFRLLVTDPSGRFDSDTVTVTVDPDAEPPAAPPMEDRIYYFPHLAVGAGWQTTITYINYSSEEVTCQTEFLSDQGTPLMVSFADRGTVPSRSDVLLPGGSVHQETNLELSAPLAPGWARATCSGPVKASLLYRRYNSEGVPTAEAGVNATTVPATRFVTFAEQGEGQFGTGVAYANPSDTETLVTFTAKDADGETLASVDKNLSPNGHAAQNMAPLFGLSSFTGSLEVTSTEPIVTLSINAEADPVFSSLPPGEVDADAQGPQQMTTYYFPHLAVGAGWQTTITYINYSPQEVSCRTEFLSDHGSPLLVSFAYRGTVVSRPDVLPPGGSVHQETNLELSAPLAPGWARATCSWPVKASLLYRRFEGGVPTGEAGVNTRTAPATRFITFAEQGEGQHGTGVAYANPSDTTTAFLTFTVRDADGEVLASDDRTLLPGGHDAKNMVDLFDLTSFTGSLEVTSTEPIVSLSLNNEADPVFSSLPPGEVDAAAQ